MGEEVLLGETNVGRVHKTLQHFLSCLPQWGDFLEPSLGPHSGTEVGWGEVQELGKKAAPAAQREREQRGSGEEQGKYL